MWAGQEELGVDVGLWSVSVREMAWGDEVGTPQLWRERPGGQELRRAEDSCERQGRG